MSSRAVWCAAMTIAACSACGAGARPASRQATTDTVASMPLPDTLVATRAGAEVWLVRGREGKHADGAACDERLIEIRRDTSRIRVPLLYTGQVPRFVNDSTLEATLWLHCVPGDLYRVNLRTGQPVKLRAAGGAQ